MSVNKQPQCVSKALPWKAILQQGSLSSLWTTPLPLEQALSDPMQLCSVFFWQWQMHIDTHKHTTQFRKSSASNVEGSSQLFNTTQTQRTRGWKISHPNNFADKNFHVQKSAKFFWTFHGFPQKISDMKILRRNILLARNPPVTDWRIDHKVAGTEFLKNGKIPYLES